MAEKIFVRVDKEACIGCGACASLCGDVFELGQDGKSQIVKEFRKGKPTEGEVEEEFATCVKDAAESCPAQAIEIEE